MKKTLFLLLALTLSGLALLQARNLPIHGHPQGPHGLPSNCIPVLTLEAFVDPLPIPRPATATGMVARFALPWNTNVFYENVPQHNITMDAIQHRFHRDLPPVEVWGYAGQYPGPTIHATPNNPLLVNWINNLPVTYPDWLPANTSFHGVSNQLVRSVVHLHGGATLPRYDGYPTNAFLSGESDLYFYGNIDLNGDGATLWYHDHAVGVTANNVYAGLAGFYILHNREFESTLNLPSEEYEIPLVLQDRDVQTNCEPASLYYNNHVYHNLAVVNGVVTPYVNVEPRRYRLRILNGANFRTFGLFLKPQVAGATNEPLYIIGNEDGFLQQTVTNTTGLNMMSGERVDVIVDFTKWNLTNVTLISSVNANAVPASAPPITNLVQFRVITPLKSKDTSAIPSVIISPSNWVTTASMTNSATVHREITLDLANEQPFPGAPFVDANGPPFALLNMSFFDDPITELPSAGDMEIWSLINLSSEPHPIHVHLLDFRVVNRQRLKGWNGVIGDPPLGVVDYINDRKAKTLKPLSYYLSTNASDLKSYQPYESGPKDVVHAAPYSVTRIVMHWPTNELFYTSPSASSLDTNTTGRYVYHCHLLEHEDDDMMRPLRLLPPNLKLRYIFDAAVNPDGHNHFRLGVGTLPNELYHFETSLDLSPGNWTPLRQNPVLGTGAEISIAPPPSTNATRFYRAKKSPAP